MAWIGLVGPHVRQIQTALDGERVAGVGDLDHQISSGVGLEHDVLGCYPVLHPDNACTTVHIDVGVATASAEVDVVDAWTTPTRVAAVERGCTWRDVEGVGSHVAAVQLGHSGATAI